MYSCIRNFLFLLPPEIAHSFSLKILAWVPNWLFPKPFNNPIECMGIKFPHKVGLAAGFDKNGEYLDTLSKFGFAFIEVGTVTPRPQSGNKKPRLFRLVKSKALINRMGFNNAGVDKLIMNIKNSNYKGILGINIGKNQDTPIECAYTDYLYCMQRVYKYADYIAINISSPNTTNLRKLQQIDYFDEFLKKIVLEHKKLAAQYNSYVPLVIKVSPDESLQDITNIAKVALKYKIDAIIATNTTSSRFNVKDKHVNERGGLSGKPISEIANQTLSQIKNIVSDKIVLIGVGGIDERKDGEKKLECGASLLQLYTGFIYNGPKLLQDTSSLS